MHRRWERRPRILCALPAPPPYSGPEIIGQQVLTSELAEQFRLTHVQTNINRANQQKGRIQARLLGGLLKLWLRVAGRLLRPRPRLTYLFLSQNLTGFVRDAAIIVTSKALGVPVAVHVQASNFGNFYGKAGRLQQAFIRWTLRGTRRVIVVADRFAPQFLPFVPRSVIVTLYNGTDVDPALFATEPRSDETAGPLTIAYLGHLSVAKGFCDVLRAIPRVLDEVPEAQFQFGGEWLVDERNILFDETGRPLPRFQPADRARWHDLQATYGDRVQHLGVVAGEDKARLLRTSAIFTLPSYSEGFPVSVLEAMAAGLPLVVTPVGALPEVLAEDVNGHFVPVGDSAALAEAIIRLARDPDLRARMGKANRDLALTRFSRQRFIMDLGAIFRGALASDGPVKPTAPPSDPA